MQLRSIRSVWWKFKASINRSPPFTPLDGWLERLIARDVTKAPRRIPMTGVSSHLRSLSATQNTRDDACVHSLRILLLFHENDRRCRPRFLSLVFFSMYCQYANTVDRPLREPDWSSENTSSFAKRSTLHNCSFPRSFTRKIVARERSRGIECVRTRRVLASETQARKRTVYVGCFRKSTPHYCISYRTKNARAKGG